MSMEQQLKRTFYRLTKQVGSLVRKIIGQQITSVHVWNVVQLYDDKPESDKDIQVSKFHVPS